MLAFILRRLLQAVIVMVTVAFLAFLLFQFVGDPVLILLGQDATPEQVAALRTALGLDRSFVVQFGHFLWNAAQGEFGISLRQGAQVSRLIAERFPATLELALAAAVLALLVGIPMGVYAALKRGTFTSQVFMALSLLGVSLPTFLIGILLILVFSVTLGWFPSFGRGEVVQLGWWSTGLLTAKGWHHLALPAVTLAIFQLTLIIRLVRAEMLEVLRTDYIKFARARGLTDRAIYFGHALKNTHFAGGGPGLGAHLRGGGRGAGAAGRFQGRLGGQLSHAPVRRDAVVSRHLGGPADCRRGPRAVSGRA